MYKCLRCNGLCYSHTIFTASGNLPNVLHCVNCGSIIDDVIISNRMLSDSGNNPKPQSPRL